MIIIIALLISVKLFKLFIKIYCKDELLNFINNKFNKVYLNISDLKI